MQANIAVISAFKSSNKKRETQHQEYLIKRCRQLFQTAVSRFEHAYGEKPNTVFVSRFLLKCIVPNPESVVKTTEEDGSSSLYYNNIRIVLVKVNMIVASVCSTPQSVEANAKEINKTKYDIIRCLDTEYKEKEENGIC